MKFRLALVASTLAASGLAQAAQYDYTVWSSVTSGSIATAGGPLGVTYAGSGSYAGETPNWGAETATWSGGVVGNTPGSANALIHLFGGDASAHSITFSQAVTNPVFAIWSLGQGGAAASFVFDETPTFISGGPSAEYGGPAISVVGNTVSGNEGNGTVEFVGTYTTLSWTNPLFENWYGFTVGTPDAAAAVPEPGSIGLLLAGLTLVGLAVRRKAR